ncbi:MAG: di-trans,poly-cis-decaprenylcistransferase [Chloroflexi bacterium]|nr:di-trans,poly-cis-decaprenylcistransferase [Chloroflexota bacterium]
MSRTSESKKLTLLPDHIAIVPDGNGRWAARRGLPRLSGHRAGAENAYRMIEYLSEYPIKSLTIYGFSTENWTRPNEEVQGLFLLLEEFIDRCVPELHQNGVRLRHIGRAHDLPPSLQQSINRAMTMTKDNTGMSLNLAFNYGGRAEIVDAVRRIVADNVPQDKINEESFANYLYTAGLPNVDLLIRTGDELRLSNFLIWQTAYSEYHFTKVLWPDFSKKDMDRALQSFGRRQRRFGGLSPRD